MRDITAHFVQFREIARCAWNFGFYPRSELLDWRGISDYDEVTARLYEALILRPFGFQEKVELTFSPGSAVPVWVTARQIGAYLRVDEQVPGELGKVWGRPTLELGREPYQFRFLRFFDWEQLAPRDLNLCEISFEQRTSAEVVARHALVEFAFCSFWLDDNGMESSKET